MKSFEMVAPAIAPIAPNEIFTAMCEGKFQRATPSEMKEFGLSENAWCYTTPRVIITLDGTDINVIERGSGTAFNLLVEETFDLVGP